MLNSTRTALAPPGADPTFAAAVKALYDQAWQLAIANLIDSSPTSTAADRYDYVLDRLLANPTDTQSRNLVKQSLSQALGLDPGVLDLLLDGNANLDWPQGLLPSNADPTKSAISDFLGGPQTRPTPPRAAAPEPTPKLSESIRVSLPRRHPDPFDGVQWTAKLLGPTTAAYCFAVTASGASASGGAAPQIACSRSTASRPQPRDTLGHIGSPSI